MFNQVCGQLGGACPWVGSDALGKTRTEADVSKLSLLWLCTHNQHHYRLI